MEKIIYTYNDKIHFRVLDRAFNLSVDEANDNREVKFVCPEHRCDFVEKSFLSGPTHLKLMCPICERDTKHQPLCLSDNRKELKQKVLSLLDQQDLKNAKLVRLDDIYTPELKTEILPNDKDYFLKTDVKTDKDGDTIVILYVGYKGKKDKTQIFIKPEKLQLTTDHKDMDPAKILAKIELTLKDRKIAQKYD